MNEDYCRCPGCGDCGGRDKAKKLMKKNKELAALIDQQTKQIKSMKEEIHLLRIISDSYDLFA